MLGNLRLTWRYALLARGTCLSFIVLSVFGTITDVLSVALLVPLLSVIGQADTMFADVAVLRYIAGLFEQFPEETRLQWLAGIMFGLIATKALIGLYSEVFRYTIPVDVERHLRLDAMQNLLDAEVLYADGLSIEKIASYCVEFPARIGIAVRFAVMFLSAAIVTLFYIGGLFLVDPIMAIITFVAVCIFALLYRAITQKRVHTISNAVTDTRESFNKNFYETVQGTIEIRLGNGRDRVLDEVRGIVGRLIDVQKKNFVLELSSQPFLSLVSGAVICALIFWIGTQPVGERSVLIAPLFVFLALLSRLISPLTIINVCRHHFSLHATVFEDFEAFMHDVRANRASDGEAKVEALDAPIELNDVDFGYEPGTTVLQNISATIGPKGFVGLVGPSGSGKSTLALLLARVYKPQSGDISVQGVDLSDASSESWTKQIGFARQGAFVPSRTIREVISNFDTSPHAEARVRAAAKQAMADAFIDALPDGYDTVLVTQGYTLSTGQKQRLILARAIYPDPDILIIDEGVSGLDAITERAILKQIDTLRESKLVLLITHDLRHVESADQILVLDKGELVQSGRYDALAAEQGVFRKMLGLP